MKRILWKSLKWTGLGLGSLLGLLFLLPILFPGTVAEQIQRWTNQNIDGRLSFAKINLSFFEHFPNLTLSLHDFTLTGSAPFAGDTLVSGRALGFGINLASLFGETLELNTVYLDGATIRVEVDAQGGANYNIYKGNSPEAQAAPDSSNTRLNIAGIFIDQCQLSYNDRSIPMRVELRDFHYEGRGDLAASQFDLQSSLRAASFDFMYDGTSYFQRRRLKAELVTGINTASLRFRFAKNDLLINKLPVDFAGEMAILKDGYDIDLNLVSGTTDFGNIFSALPPEYDQWFAGTRFSGLSQIRVAMNGHYRAATQEAPDLSVKLWVHDGSIRHQQAPAPLEHLWLSSTLRLPALQPDRLTVAIDTLNFQLVDGVTRAAIFLEGLDKTRVKADIQSRLDLGLLDQALGLSALDLKGDLQCALQADGIYQATEKAVVTIPNYRLTAGISEGYFKLADFELPIQNLRANIRSSCSSGKFADIELAIDSLHAGLGTGEIAGSLRVAGLEKSTISADLNARLALEDLARAVPIEDYVFGGNLNLQVRAEGALDPDKKRFPAATGSIELHHGRLKTPYYPQPIEQLEALVQLDCKSGTYNDLDIRLQPLSFVFEQQPFSIDADLHNPDDLHYRVRAKGTLDLGKIYQVFALEGIGLNGLLKADLELRGVESDAVAGRYERLYNQGTLQLQRLVLHSADYPDPLLIPNSTLRFEQDKARLSDMRLRYRDNEFALDGYAQNLIGYALGSGIAKGELSVRSARICIDDFMALAPPPAATAKPVAQTSPAGVVLLPKGLDLSLKAEADRIVYGTTTIQDFNGQLTLQNGRLDLLETRCGLAGATVRISGNYTPVHARKAEFGFRFQADSFDVKRAYDEVELFRDMASAAEKASGLITMDYRVEGRLNAAMEPVLPSIKGEGFIKLEQVKVNGLKLFGAVSKATGKTDIDNPELKAVVMKSSIANNIITIERTKMKVLGFRPRIEGQTSLDGRLNLRFRLGLPPFGVLGIPMTITGTSEEPVVEIRKGKEADELEEAADEEEEQQ